MHRLLAATAALATLLFAAPVLAQTDPNSTGAGTQRGLQELNNSGQVGDVTLFARGSKTLVVIDLHSVPGGRHEAAHIHRGKGCGETIDPKPVYPLGDVVGGRSSTLVDAPEAKLLSGNYVVVVHSHSATMAMGGMSMSSMPGLDSPKSYVSCGLLFR